MKKLIAILALTFATPVVIVPAAFAQAPAFSAVDANGDGSASMEELKAAFPEVEEARFVAADADNSGSLSEEEYTALSAG